MAHDQRCSARTNKYVGCLKSIVFRYAQFYNSSKLIRIEEINKFIPMSWLSRNLDAIQKVFL